MGVSKLIKLYEEFCALSIGTNLSKFFHTKFFYTLQNEKYSFSPKSQKKLL